MTAHALLYPISTIIRFNDMSLFKIWSSISIVPIITVELNLYIYSKHLNGFLPVNKLEFGLLGCLEYSLMEVEWYLVNYTVCHVAHVDWFKLMGVVIANTHKPWFDHQQYQSWRISCKYNYLKHHPIEAAASPFF